MGKSNESSKNIAPEQSGVDMKRIKDMMGPLPDEQKQLPLKDEDELAEKVITPSTAPEVAEPNREITDAANEANETLKAMSSDLGTANITRIADDDTLSDSLALNESPLTDASEDEGLVADDTSTVKAVDDIIAHEADTVLEAEDEARDTTAEAKPPKRGFKEWFKDIWAKPAGRWGIIGGASLFIIILFAIPQSRYFVLNNLSIRSSVGITIIDSSTQLPLKDVTVSVAGNTAQTDNDGNARLYHVRLGATTLQVSKRAFTGIDQKVTVGWGSNPLSQLSLNPSGSQYTFTVTDYLSGKPVERVQAVSGEGNAASDDTGKIVLTLDNSGKKDTDEVEVSFVLAGYRTETIKINLATKTATGVKLVNSRKEVFVSNRSGKYDIYTVDIDGKNEKKIISATGLERADLALAPQQGSATAAYIASRENVRNSDGYLLSTLYFLDTDSGILTKADQSEQIQAIGWSNDGRLIYVKIAAGTSSGNNKRFRLQSVNSKNVSDNKELASANYFNDVVMAGNRVLYAPSSALKDTTPGLFAINSDGGGLLKITDKEIYNIFRTDYNTVTVDASGSFFTYLIGSPASSLSSVPAPSTTNHLYVDNQAGTKGLWVDNRDGKGVLLAYDKTNKKDTVLASVGGLKLPVVWLSDSVAVYRLNDGKQSADYAVSTEGGTPQKITDLTDVDGVSRWYGY